MIIAFALLTQETVLIACQRALFVLAGLVHGLDHAERYAPRRLFASETASARLVMHFILGIGVDARLSLQLLWPLKATALTFHED